MPKQVKDKISADQLIPEQANVKIEQLFGSKTRVRLLSLFLENSDRAFYVRELTRRIDAQLNSVRRELSNLVDIGIVLEVDGSILKEEKPSATKRKKFYQVNDNFLFFDELRAILKKSAILMNRSFVQEISCHGTIDLLFLTGKFIDNDTVPSDMLIVGAIDLVALEKTISELERNLGHEINYTFMPPEEFKYRKEIKDRFLASLFETEKVVLVDNIE